MPMQFSVHRNKAHDALAFCAKGHIQHTFLLCPMAGDIKKHQETTMFANLKALKVDNICTCCAWVITCKATHGQIELVNVYLKYCEQ